MKDIDNIGDDRDETGGADTPAGGGDPAEGEDAETEAERAIAAKRRQLRGSGLDLGPPRGRTLPLSISAGW